jgi:hypothetical protein
VPGILPGMGVKAAGAKGCQPYNLHVPIVSKYEGLILAPLLASTRPVQGLLYLLLMFYFMIESGLEMDFDARELCLHITQRSSFNEAISNTGMPFKTTIHEVMKPQTCSKNVSLIKCGFKLTLRSCFKMKQAYAYAELR